MTLTRRISSIRRIALTVVILAAAPAAAAPPANDDFDQATRILTIPFTTTLNTVEATAAADDPGCTFGPTPTVWYTFTPSVNMRIRASTSGSDYDTVLCVFTGTRATLTDVAGNDDTPSDVQALVDFDAMAGETYFFLVGTTTGKTTGSPGGNLVFTVDTAPPPLTIKLRVDEAGSFDRDGNVTLRGVVTCSRSVFVDLSGRARQRAGRLLVDGAGFATIPCDGPTPWQVTLSSARVLFKGGPVLTFVLAQAFDFETDELAIDQTLAVVRLRGSR